MARAATVDPLRICLIGAGSSCGYALLPLIADGEGFGLDRPIQLVLLTDDRSVDQVEGLPSLQDLAMELEDSQYPLLQSVEICDAEKAPDCSYAIVLLSSKTDNANAKQHFKTCLDVLRPLALVLRAPSAKRTKVVVAGSCACTNALALTELAPQFPKANITVVARLDQNRATAMVAAKLRCNVKDISNVIVWGSPGPSCYPDVSEAEVNEDSSVSDALGPQGERWATDELVTSVRERSREVMARGAAMSTARAISQHCYDIHCGVGTTTVCSMGVYLAVPRFGFDQGMFVSLPCTCSGNGEFRIVDMSIDDTLEPYLAAASEELKDQMETVLGLIEDE